MLRRLRPPREGRLHLAVLAGGLLVAGAILVGFARRLYFFGDDWEFLLTRGTVEGADLGLLAPHNEHWSTVPILLFRALFAVFGLDQYLPFALPVILAHLALCALLYAVLVRLGCARGAAVAAALVLAFFGGGAQNTLWDFQVGFVTPVALAMAAVGAWSRWPDRRGVAVTGGLLALALMCSGVGIAAVVLVVGFVTLTSGPRSAVAVGAGPTLLFFLWFLTVGRTESTIEVADRSTYLLVPAYVWTGLTSALERAAGIDGAGPVLLVALLAAPFVVRDLAPGVRALAVAGIVTALVQLTLQGWSRVGLGVEQATAGRYAYLTVAFLSPAVAVGCGWLVRRVQPPVWAAALLAAVLGVGYVVNGIHEQHEFVEKRSELAPDLQRLLRGVQAVTAGGQTVLSEQPFPDHHPDITVALLDAPAVRAALPGGPVTPQTELDATALVGVGVGRTAFGLPPAADVRLGAGTTVTDVEGGCRRYLAPRGRAELSFDSGTAGAEVRLAGDAAWVTTSVLLDGRRSTPNHRRLVAGEPVFVAVDVPGATLRVRFGRGGPLEVCAAG